MKQIANALKITRGPNLTEQVRCALSDEILSGKHQLGDALPSEQVLAQQFGVSRTVMREAISHLRADGLISTKQGVGAFVIANHIYYPFRLDVPDKSDRDALLNVLELRSGFEVEAAGLAALRRKQSHINSMRKAIKAMERAVKSGDIEAGVKADLDFHEAICSATGNPHFESFFAFIKQYLEPSIKLSRKLSAGRNREYHSQDEHLAIFEAILAEDQQAAREMAREHVAGTIERANSNY